MSKLLLDDWKQLIVHKDGDSYFVSTMDFIDLQSSPVIFLNPIQCKIMDEWYPVSLCPIIHLPLVEVSDIIHRYNRGVVKVGK